MTPMTPMTPLTTLTTRSGTRLRERFRGALLRPGEEGYDEARRTWNGAVDRRPALIARCAGADDVVEVVRWARDQDLPLTVRGGGHSVQGHAVADGAVTVDLSLLKGVQVDPAARTARAAGGAVWGEFDLATQRHGLATTGGTVSRVGVAGSTLAGGFGHLARRHGLTVDNLRAADLVTADGRRVRADADRTPELLWGLRGGGGNFGIATALEYDLHPVGPLVLGGFVYWPLDQAALVLRALAEFSATAPDEFSAVVVAHRAPPLPFLPPAWSGRPVLGLLLAWCGGFEEGTRVLAPLRAVGNPVADAVRPIPYRVLQTVLDAGVPGGDAATWRSQRLERLTDPVAQEVAARVESAPSPQAVVTGWVLGGAAGRVPAEATAVGGREGFELRFVALWPAGTDPGPHREWVRQGWEALRPYATGEQFATFLSDEGPAGVRAAYGSRLARLAALKNTYDPGNVLSANVNIVPSGGSK
ncbi:FAD-binding oxidoreductase [Kineococcus sp. SYSU DK003]|uniref:FAD-binding oxidoreductase n=1 Tax=Kineococcus sp. SYSU DK003 TaxID=3383124 RepID=UPI003D7F0A02